MQDSYLYRSETFPPTMTKQQREATGAGESRPPLYNSEDYIAALKRFSRLTGLQMYLGSDGGGGFGNGDGAEKAENKGGGKSAKTAKNESSATTSNTNAAAGTVTCTGNCTETYLRTVRSEYFVYPS